MHESVWKPLYSGMVANSGGEYRMESSAESVNLWIGAYGLGAVSGSEMIAYGNRMYEAEHESMYPERVVRLPLDGRRSLQVREVRVAEGGAGSIIWYWYDVDGRLTTNTLVAKWFEVLALVTRQSATERVIALEARASDVEVSRAVLEKFIIDHIGCLTRPKTKTSCL